MAAFLPDSLAQAEAMDTHDDVTRKGNKDAAGGGTGSIMNGDIHTPQSQDVEMADDSAKVKTGDASTKPSTPDNIGYLTLSGGRLLFMASDAESRTGEGGVNGCDSADSQKPPSPVVPPDKDRDKSGNSDVVNSVSNNGEIKSKPAESDVKHSVEKSTPVSGNMDHSETSETVTDEEKCLSNKHNFSGSVSEADKTAKSNSSDKRMSVSESAEKISDMSSVSNSIEKTVDVPENSRSTDMSGHVSASANSSTLSPSEQYDKTNVSSSVSKTVSEREDKTSDVSPSFCKNANLTSDVSSVVSDTEGVSPCVSERADNVTVCDGANKSTNVSTPVCENAKKTSDATSSLSDSEDTTVNPSCVPDNDSKTSLSETANKISDDFPSVCENGSKTMDTSLSLSEKTMDKSPVVSDGVTNRDDASGGSDKTNEAGPRPVSKSADNCMEVGEVCEKQDSATNSAVTVPNDSAPNDGENKENDMKISGPTDDPIADEKSDPSGSLHEDMEVDEVTEQLADNESDTKTSGDDLAKEKHAVETEVTEQPQSAADQVSASKYQLDKNATSGDAVTYNSKSEGQASAESGSPSHSSEKTQSFKGSETSQVLRATLENCEKLTTDTSEKLATDNGEKLPTDHSENKSENNGDKSKTESSEPHKTTARKTSQGGNIKPKLSKGTARKTGQPQATSKVTFTCNDKGSGEGTIKIFNLHPNSNITLKMSELEKVLKPPKLKDSSKLVSADTIIKKEPTAPVNKEVSRNAEAVSSDFESDTSPSPTSLDSSGGRSSLKMHHRRRRKKGGTYDFPGGKKNPKKKKLYIFSSSTYEPKSESKHDSKDFPPIRKLIRKPSPHKQYTVMEFFKNQSFHKNHNSSDVIHHKSSAIPLSGKTVYQILQERRLTEGSLPEKEPRHITVGETGPGTGSEGGKKPTVQKLFVSSTVSKDGLVSSVKVEDARERENQNHGSVLKRKQSGNGNATVPTSNSDGSGVKKARLSEGEGPKSPHPPMVMVVAQHNQNAPGLRSILPKPHLASSVPVTDSTTVSSSQAPVMVSAGQKLLLAAPPILVKPGTKVALVPVSVKGSNPFSLLPASVVSSKGRGVAASGMSSLPKVLNLHSTMSASKNTDALRCLLSPSNGPRLKTVSMVHGPISSAQRLNVPSGMSTAQSKVLSASLSAPILSSSMKCVVSEGRVVGSLPNGLLPVTPPKTPDAEAAAVAEGMASTSSAESDAIPLCCCKIVGTFFNKTCSGVTYCQALDSVDGKALGCCNKVSNLQLVRPGVKIPFMAVCELHRKRLKSHQCCPGCGHFCTQGKFYQCRQDGSTIHNFHRQCQTERDGRLFCPHCGEESKQVEVTLTLNEPKQNQTCEEIRANLRKAISKARMTPSSGGKKKTSESKPGLSVTLPNMKTISSEGLEVGPDRDSLERLFDLCVMKTERPKKYRVLPKNMYYPACEGDIDKVFYMLMDGMDGNQTCEEEDNQTVLHGAVYSGNLALVYLLVQAGACIHTPDKSLKTPLMCTSEYGHLPILKFLVKAGARLEDRGEDHMTCLHAAAKAGHMGIIEYILDIEAIDVNATDEGGWTPLMWATESQLVDVVKFLVSRGGDPNKKDNEENNALHWAAFAGSIEIAELFLDLGCELDSPNEHGDRPLHIAARQDHYDVVVILLARGANVDLRNNKDETPVACCVNTNSQVCMALKVNKQLRSFAAKLSRPEKLSHRDISIGREKNPIACVNAVDDDPSPTDYLYVNHNVETQDLHINNVITSLQSCRCKDDCSSVFCVCSRSSVKCWFDKFGRLIEDFNLLDPPLIFECNKACRCWVNCNNRVVQNGITVRMQVFRTSGRGWGVRSLTDIPKGTFICEYIGELISDQEADRREDDSYLFDLDNKDGDTYCLDARKYGNVARFINHLCEPNLVPVKVFVDHQDLRFPRICFFSSRPIKAYEEFGFDYGEKFWIIKWKQFTCACGSSKCKYSTDTIKRTLEEYRLRHEDEDLGPEAS